MRVRWAILIGGALAIASLTPAGAQTTPPPAAEPGLAAGPPGGLSAAEIRTLIDAAQATAKATREGVEYARVTPDLLNQILTKLDKIENKLDKIEDAVKAQAARRR